MYKTTIEIWTEYDGAAVTLDYLAFEAIEGSAICTRQTSEQIPAVDAPADVQSFFDLGDKGGER